MMRIELRKTYQIFEYKCEHFGRVDDVMQSDNVGMFELLQN